MIVKLADVLFTKQWPSVNSNSISLAWVRMASTRCPRLLDFEIESMASSPSRRCGSRLIYKNVNWPMVLASSRRR